MHSDDVEPLEPSHWMRRIRQLRMWTLGDEADLERGLRHAFHLVQLTPRPLRHIIHCTSSEAEFEALLKARAFEAAVLRLIGNRTPYSVTQATDGLNITAEIRYPDQYDRHSATEPSPALALFRAWLECHIAIAGTDEPERSARPIKLAQGETSTEH